MEFVILPQGLFIVYGALVLSCGIGLGAVLGRNLLRRRHAPIPEPPALFPDSWSSSPLGIDGDRFEA